MAVATQAGVLQRLRFSALGTTLSAKVWPNTANEPQDWMLTVDDHTFTTGRFGIRVVEQPATVITIISFNAVKASAANDM